MHEKVGSHIKWCDLVGDQIVLPTNLAICIFNPFVKWIVLIANLLMGGSLSVSHYCSMATDVINVDWS